MKRTAIIVLAVAASAPMALGTVTFYLSPGAGDGSGDVAWETAVGNNFVEFDLEEFSHGQDVDKLVAGSLVVDLGQAGISGTATTAEIFHGSWGSQPAGTIVGNALLNRDSSGTAHSEITFSFNNPVQGFGAWIFDNTMASPESFHLIVTEVGGGITTSPVLESGNGNDHAVEGWIGATSTLGITNASIQVVDGEDGKPVARYFEVDNIHVVPAPGAVLLGVMGVGMVGWLTRRARKAKT